MKALFRAGGMVLATVVCLQAEPPAAIRLGLPVPMATQGIRPSGPQAAGVQSERGVPGHQVCGSCHRGHVDAWNRGMAAFRKVMASPGAQPPEDRACQACHDAQPAARLGPGAPQVRREGAEGSSHLAGRGRSGETYVRTVTAAGKRIQLSYTCQGCHDPHGKERGRLRSLAFDARGQVLARRAQMEADRCFACHAGPEAARLASGQIDLGALFARTASGHALGATAASRPELPSLRTTVFQGPLDCGSCHGRPDGTGARGPHGSPHVSLLKAAFGRERDLARLGERANDLCYLCHDRQSVLANQSFPFHRQHLTGFTQSGSTLPARQASGRSEAEAMLGVRSARDLRPGRGGAFLPGYGEPTVCATCHASHGSLRQPGLIEFDRSVVSASYLGTVSFQQTSPGHGTCTLTCHGYDHVQSRY